MKIEWEVSDLQVGDSSLFEVRESSGHWVPARLVLHDGETPETSAACCLVTMHDSYIGPFQNREALVGWMNTSGRVRMRN